MHHARPDRPGGPADAGRHRTTTTPANLATAEATHFEVHRGAASLALQRGELRAAEQVIVQALADDPSDEVRNQHRGQLEPLYLERQLDANCLQHAGDAPLGELILADATAGKQGTLGLRDTSTGKRLKLKVPLALMADIVRPLFQERVTVTGYLVTEDVLELEDIARADD